MSKKIVVDMSGGVDPSVAAWLLKEQGYDVTGVTMQIWQDEDAEVQETEGGYCGLSVVGGARRVTMDLGIPYCVMSFKGEFRKNMMDYFAGGYMGGRTPNPCITCNRHVKWESLSRWSMAIGADYITTGYYAQIDSLPGGRCSLKTSVTATEDRTYALHNLTREQPSHTLVPVGSYHREETRDMVERLRPPVAHKPDNQEICFIPGHDYASFIEEYTGGELLPGNFVGLDSNVLGRHRGITRYIVGQKKGLNLSMGRPIFVVGIHPETNEVVIGDNQDVFTNVLRCGRLNWIAVDGLHGKPMDVLTKIRYSHKGSSCAIREIGYDTVGCRFHEPVRTATPGQAAVFYNGDYMTGGGTIIGRNGR